MHPVNDDDLTSAILWRYPAWRSSRECFDSRIKTFVLQSCLNLLRSFGELLIIIWPPIDRSDSGTALLMYTYACISSTTTKPEAHLLFTTASEIINSEWVPLSSPMQRWICQYFETKIDSEIFCETFPKLLFCRSQLPGTHNEPLMMSRAFQEKMKGMQLARQPQEIIC